MGDTNIITKNESIYSVIPVEHLLFETIDRLDDFVLVSIDYLSFPDYVNDSILSEEEKTVLSVLFGDEKAREILSEFKYCTLFIRKRKYKDFKKEVFDVECACDFIAISQYRFDRKEWLMSMPGVVGWFMIDFWVDIQSKLIEIKYEKKHYFHEVPGLGLEVSFYPLESDKDFYPFLFADRKDEVFLTCRYYVSKACRSYRIPSLQSTFSELFACLEGLGMIGSSGFLTFTKEKARMMAVTSSNQNEYEQKLNQYRFYSETLRTLVLHQGHSLLEYMDRQSVFRLLTSIFWEIVTFATKIIETDIHTFSELDQYIETLQSKYEDDIDYKNNFLLSNEELGFEGNRDVFIFAVDNIVLDEPISLGVNIQILPKGFLERCKSRPELLMNLMTENGAKLLADKIIELNNEKPVLLKVGEYKKEQIDTSMDSWQYIDDICGDLQNMLSPLYVIQEYCVNRDCYIGAVGMKNGIRGGLIFDTAFSEVFSLCGRVYELFSNTENPFKVESGSIDEELVRIVCSENRKDEVAFACRDVIITIGKAMREDDTTYALMDIFDAVDKLYPYSYNIKDKWQWLAAFSMDTRSDYDAIHTRLRNLGQSYRTMMYHHGKSAIDLFNTEQDFQIVFNELKSLLIKAVKKQYNTGCISWDDLKTYKRNMMTNN